MLRILRGAGKEGLCGAEVTERLIAKVPDATRLLDRLEAAGLLARERGSDDRRFVTTRITSEGLRLLARMDAPVEALHKAQFAHLTRTQVRTLIDLLAELRDSA